MTHIAATPKSWRGGAVELSFEPQADSSFAAFAGQSGMLAVARVDYGGFEPVQRLVSAAVVGESPIDPSLATHIALLPANDGQHVGVNADQTLIDDALDERAIDRHPDVEVRQLQDREAVESIRQLGEPDFDIDDFVLTSRFDHSAHDATSYGGNCRSAGHARQESAAR